MKFICLHNRPPVLKMYDFFDIFAVVVTIGLAITGFREGFFRGAFKLAGFVATLILLGFFSGEIDRLSSIFIPVASSIILPVLFIGILLISAVVFHILAQFLHTLIKITPVVFIDSGAGCLFGIIKALFLNGFIAILLSLSPPGTFLHNQYASSHFAGTFKQFLWETVPLIKSSVAPLYRRYLPKPEQDDSVPEKPEKNNHEKDTTTNII